jgi:hypothetical protein
VDNEGQTLLYNLHDHDIFDLMVQAGCDINHRDNQGKAVLEFATDISGGYSFQNAHSSYYRRIAVQ